jgi:hypothetical protein
MMVGISPLPPLASLSFVPPVFPLSGYKPTVFILTTSGQEVKTQTNACRAMFHSLGFGTTPLIGIEASFSLPHPRTHWAWALVFLPKVRMMCHWHGLKKTDAIVLAENSCWPTDRCTPARLQEVLDGVVAQGSVGAWIGYTGCVSKTRHFTQTFNRTGRLVDVPGECKAPRGSKLFVITVEGLDILCKAFECAPSDWFVDTMNQCKVASGHVVVTRPALAGSMKHYSERCGHDVLDDELAENLREGEFLAIGKIFQV